jgi:hypothetical protein
VPAPYGLEATRAFLETTLRALGHEDAGDRLAERAAGFERLHWAPRVALARGHRLGIVCEQARLQRLAGTGSSGGVPLVPVLLEMGFPVSLALVPDPDAPVDPAGDVARWTAAGVETAVVETPEALAAWLAEPRIEAVFSDYFFDARLVRTGHAPFSLRNFEKGWQGAARTLDRLLDRCTIGCIRRTD